MQIGYTLNIKENQMLAIEMKIGCKL